MKKIGLILLLLVNFSVPAYSQTKATESVYTSLAAKNCKVGEEDYLTLIECTGIAGYKLVITVGDAREDLAIIAPGGKKEELDFFENVSPGFSGFGEKVEWRVRRRGKGIKPLSLIVRFDVNDADEPRKVKPYLVVVKIANDSSCITDVVKASKNQNLEARRLADDSAAKTCLALANIPKLIEKLADENEYISNAGAAALKKAGPGVIEPLTESLKEKKFCDYRYKAAEVIRYHDKNHPILKPTYFDLATGKCEYRYSPEKYLPDANAGAIISMFNSAEILVTKIEGGAELLPELMKDEDVGLLSSLYAFRGIMTTIAEQKQKNEKVKPEIINALKATIPVLEKAIEIKDNKQRCDYYDILKWMKESEFEELRVDAAQALQGKTADCSN